MWITPDVNIPEELLAAQRSDRLVVFAGAGVSVAPPSDLPRFAPLARRIGEEAGCVVTEKHLESPDRFLGDLEAKTNVHQRVHDLVGDRQSRPNALHAALLRLAVAGGRSLRLVTTNYDLHFTTASRELGLDAPRFDGPALPLGDDFSGIVHVHGSLDQESRRLVVTDRDFGHAYLTDAWAARFLQSMFRRYTVLFVGYSHADVVMYYLARGLPRGTSRYALVPDDELSSWRGLDIETVAYPKSSDDSHNALTTAIEKWADRTSMGLLDHRRRIADLVSAPPPEEPVDADYLVDALTSEPGAAFFAEAARGAVWLDWAETQPTFKGLAADTDESPGAPALARWFVNNYVLLESESQRALKTVQLFDGRIGPLLWREIAFGLSRANDERPSTFQAWVAILLETMPTYTSDALDYLLINCHWPVERPAALLLMDHLTSPHLTVQPIFPRWRDPDEADTRQVRPEVSVRGKQYWLAQAWQTIFAPHLDEVADELVDIASCSLSKAHDLLAAFAGASHDWDPSSFGRSAIEPHEQDQHPDSMDVVIDIARDSLEHVLEHSAAIGSGLLASWTDSDAPLLRRLAVHGWSHRNDKTPDEKLHWLLEGSRLFDHAAKHELFRLLQLCLPVASIQLRDSVVDKVVEEAPQSEHHDYSVYNYLVWITTVDPDLGKAADALKQLQQQHTDFGPREHPDLDHWSGAGFVTSTFPLSTGELHDRILNDAHSALQGIVGHVNADSFGRSGLQVALEQVSTVVAAWPADGHDLLACIEDLEGSDDAEGLWRSVINGWTAATLDHDQWASVLSSLERASTSSELSYAIAQLLKLGARAQDSGLSVDLIPAARALAQRAWTMATGIQNDLLSSTGWYAAAINAAAGAIAEFWLHSIAIEWRSSQDSWTGLHTEVAAELESMMSDSGPRGAAARAVIGAELSFLFGADENWCLQSLFPLFDWESSPSDHAAQVWDGYLQVGRWNERLLHEGLLDLFVKATPNIESDLPDRRDRFCEHLAAIALISDMDPLETGWLTRFIAQASDDFRTAWASGVRVTLQSNTTDLAERRWVEWMKAYWEQRLRSVPAPLSAGEGAAMAAWVPHLGNGFPEAAHLALKTPAALNHRNLLVHSLVESSALSHHPDDAIRLLTHLLTITPSGTEPEYQLEECVRTLAQHASEDQLRPLIEAAIQAGYQHAASWIEDT